MKILLLGKKGQLGWELQRCLAPLGVVTGLDIDELDLLDFEAVRGTIRSLAPSVIVNASAYTAVDKAESEADKAFAINGVIPGILAEEALALKAALIHYSTDYVFDGGKGSSYSEYDLPNPLNVYGKSKLAGERAIQAAGGSFLIFRTAWVFSTRRDSFISKVLAWSRQNETLKIVDDQVSNPTWARALAEVTSLILARGVPYISERSGLYHLAGSGYASRLDWAKEILKLDPKPQEQLAKLILPCSSCDFPTPALRPLFSAMDCSKFSAAFDLSLPEWQKSLQLAMEV